MATNDGRVCGGRERTKGLAAADGRQEGGREKGQSAAEWKPLPQRVGELFQMHDFGGDSSSFFRSPFLREKLPQILFSNGTSGLGNGGGTTTVTGVVRHIPIKVLEGDAQQPQQHRPRQQRQTQTAAGTAHQQQRDTADSMESSPSRLSSRDFPSFHSSSGRLSMNSPELRRHFDSLFWTPQQARRIAEREGLPGEENGNAGTGGESEPQQRKHSLGEPLSSGGAEGRMDRSQLLGGSTVFRLIPTAFGVLFWVTVYTIPISSSSSSSANVPVERRERDRETSLPGRVLLEAGRRREAAENGDANSIPYSAIPFRDNRNRRAGLNPALSTPSLFVSRQDAGNSNGSANGRNHTANAQKPPKAPTSFPASRPFVPHSVPQRPSQNCPPSANLPPVLRRTQTQFSLPQQPLTRRDSEPAIVVAEEREKGAEEERKDTNGKGNGRQLRVGAEGGKQSADSSPLADDQSSLSESVSAVSSSTTTSSSRAKSPSLSSIRQSLFRLRPSAVKKSSNASSGSSPFVSASSLVPTCVRARQSSGSDVEEEESGGRRTARKADSAPLTTASLRLTEFLPKGDEAKLDAVEEAIRSLEQFDPGEFVSQQYTETGNGRPAEQRRHATAPKVFLARAEPVPVPQPHSLLHPSGSVGSLPEGRSPLSLSSTSFEPTSSAEDTPFLPARRTSTVSSGSATPTILSFSRQSSSDPVFSQSMDSNRTPRANSPATRRTGEGDRHSAPGINQLLSRLRGEEAQKGAAARRGVTFNDNPIEHHYAPFDGPPPDYSDSDEEDYRDREEDDDGSVADSENGDANEAAVEAEAQLRKRFLCSQLTDCAKVVEINALKMSQFVAAGIGHGGWRQSHILRHNLVAIRDTCYTIAFALDELVESLGRISLDQRDFRHVQLRQLAQPVKTSLAMLRRLRNSLDSTGWSLPTLARPAGAYYGQDALDQFVAILPQLPKDCYKLVQWIYSLSVWRDSSAASGRSCVFLSSFSSASSPASASFHPALHPPPPPPAPRPAQQNGNLRSSSPTSSLLNYYSTSESEEPTPNRSSNAPATTLGATGGWQRAGADAMDGGESTTAWWEGESTSSTGSAMTVEEKAPNGGKRPAENGAEKAVAPPAVVEAGTGIVVQEEDLASVVSEAASDIHWESSPSSPTSAQHQRRVNAELSQSLSPEQRELFRLYEPQICAHLSALCAQIETFFSLIEGNKEPKLSFQKVQMIFIEGHSLVGIMRVLVRDDCISPHRPLSAFLEHESGRLDSLLNECLATAKVAKAKAQTVPAVQAMCSAVVAVSESASQLKGFWRACAGGRN